MFARFFPKPLPVDQPAYCAANGSAGTLCRIAVTFSAG